MSDCQVCADKPHGALPRWFKGSHCYGCHASWRGIAAAHTKCCHLTFSSNLAADLHLVRGKCTDPALVQDEDERFVFDAVVRADGNVYWTPLDPSERGRIAVNYASNGPEGPVGAENVA